MRPYDIVHAAGTRLARAAGFQVRRISPAYTDDLAIREHLAQFGVDLVLDVGANQGQFARSILEAGYRGRIVSFEPLRGPHAQASRLAERWAGWTVFDRCAIGDHEGEIEIHISENSVASSPLPLTEDLLRHSSDAAYVGTERAPIHTLDGISDRVLDGAQRPFVKVDVQGYETQVLAGAKALLSRVVGLHLELCLVELYRGQALFPELVRWIGDEGFTIYRLAPSFLDPKTGRWLAVDALCFREASA